MLDEGFRRRVAEVARRNEESLDEEARQRIVRKVVERGPDVVARARRQRWAYAVGAPVLAAAAGVALLLTLDDSPRDPGGAAAPGSVAASRECAAMDPPAATRFGKSGERWQRLRLEGRALLVAPSESNVELVELGRCRTVVALKAGEVVVAAHDLDGGELLVRAGASVVRVVGTVFSVGRDGDSVTVEVVDGTVAVDRDGRERRVVAGRRLLVSPVGVASGELSDARRRQLRQRLGEQEVIRLDALDRVEEREARTGPAPAPSAEQASAGTARATGAQSAESAATGDDTEGGVSLTLPETASAGELLQRAERARRGGRHGEARGLYRRAGAGSGPTAEAAWLALARMELSLGNAAGAREATRAREQRFSGGSLGPEALWIDVRTHRQLGDPVRAREAAKQLVDRWPDSPQADAARRWLGER